MKSSLELPARAPRQKDKWDPPSLFTRRSAAAVVEMARRHMQIVRQLGRGLVTAR